MPKRKKKTDTAPLENEITAENANGNVEVVSEEEVNEVMKKYDKESNTRHWVGLPKKIITGVMAIFSLYCIWSTLFSNASLEIRLMIFLGCVVIMGYLYYPAS